MIPIAFCYAIAPSSVISVGGSAGFTFSQFIEPITNILVIDGR